MKERFKIYSTALIPVAVYTVVTAVLLYITRDASPWVNTGVIAIGMVVGWCVAAYMGKRQRADGS